MSARIFPGITLPHVSYERLIELLLVESVRTGKTSRRHALPKGCFRNTGGIRAFTAANAEAALKSGEILARGLRALDFNVHGAAIMTVDDGLSAARALMGCRTVPHWFRLHSELVKLNAGRAAIRALLLSVMSLQVTDEALFPLIMRVNAAHGLFARTMSA